MNWDDVAQALADRMDELGVSQRQLAHDADVSVTTVKELLWNRNPRQRAGRTLSAISTALDWPSGKLLAIARGTEVTPTHDEEIADLRARMEKVERRLDNLEPP